MTRTAPRDKKRPDLEALFRFASTQSGYFTSAQAMQFGFGPALCWHYVKRGRLMRRRRGLYRFHDFGPSPHEEVIAGFLAVGIGGAIVSHDSALALHGLLDPPAAVHVTIPRSLRRVAPPGVVLHTSVRLPTESEMTVREGIPVTSPARSIIDFASRSPSRRLLAAVVARALERDLTTTMHLLFSAQERSRNVSRSIQEALG